MRISDAQKDVDKWVSQFKVGYFPTFALLASITEELGEVSKVLQVEECIKPLKAGDKKPDLEEELGDLLFDLICLANSKGINLESAFQRKMEKCNSRDSSRWQKK